MSTDYGRDLAYAAELVLGSARNWAAHKPFGRQEIFLIQLKDELEAFYGGAAGGMKSDALLQAALEYVDTPGYSALLLRRTYQDLSKPGALMDRAAEWLRPHIPAAKWNDQKKQWRFPSGAVLTFGYLETESDKYQYQSAEYQFIGFDELTQFTESQYLYLFSRLRRLEGSTIPLRMRSASNPGGEGHNWVRGRFIPDDFTPADAELARVWSKTGIDADGKPLKTFFVPSRVQDNPFLDQTAYIESLHRLDRVTREQLLSGDWSIAVAGRQRFGEEAIRLFTPIRPSTGELRQSRDSLGQEHAVFYPSENGVVAIWQKPIRGHHYVIGADTAEGRENSSGDPDYSVAQIRNQETGEQVARLRGRITERAFGEYVYILGRWYNNAFIVPEVKGGYGRAMLDKLLDLGYPMHRIFDKHLLNQLPAQHRARSVSYHDLGWDTNSVNRPTLISVLAEAILEHSIKTYDAVTIEEYRHFCTNSDGKDEAESGYHDDCVIADALCVLGIRVAPRSGLPASSSLPRK